MKEQLWHVTSDYFCACVVSVKGVITEGAPILNWSKGMSVKNFINYCRFRGWEVGTTDMLTYKFNKEMLD